MKQHLIHQNISIKYFVSKLSPLAKRDAHARNSRAPSPSSKHQHNTRDKKRKKETFVQFVDKQAEKANKISFRNESSHCVNPSSRNLTISFPSPPPSQSRNGSRSDDTTTGHDPSFPWLSLRASVSSIADRDSTVRKLGSFETFLFFYSSLVSSTRIRRSRNKSGVVILFFCKRRRKTEGKRAITSTRRSIIDRTFERSPVESSIIERSSRMQKGLQAGWGWREAGTIMPRLKDRFERWRVSWLIMNIDGCGGWERSRNCFRRFLFFQICLCHVPDFVFWK